MDSIIDLLREQRKRLGRVEGGLARGQYHHKRILDAIVRRDPQAARQEMQDHLIQVRRDSDPSTASRG
jgi:GntR family transcriptional repressor for pyruvate dehydrogenase complex